MTEFKFSNMGKKSLTGLSNESLFLALGVGISCLHLIALNLWSTPFGIGLILSTLIASLIFIGSNTNVVGYAIAVSITLWLSGTKLICWDTASFELPNFYDWMNGLRGAYWDYSKLPSMFFGLGYTLGRDAYRLVYTLQVILLVIGLSQITTETRSPFYFFAVTFLLLNLFPQLFDHGKGDLFALDFSLIALRFAPIKPMKSADQEGRHWSIFLLFGSLAIASKLSAVLAVIPLGVLAAARGGILQIYRRNMLLITLILALTIANFSINFYNLVHYGSILDPVNASSGSALSLIHHLRRLASAAIAFPPNLYAAAILGTALIAVESITSLQTNSELKIKNSVLLFVLLTTPLVFLFEFRESTNLRLISLPMLAIWAINTRRTDASHTA